MGRGGKEAGRAGGAPRGCCAPAQPPPCPCRPLAQQFATEGVERGLHEVGQVVFLLKHGDLGGMAGGGGCGGGMVPRRWPAGARACARGATLIDSRASGTGHHVC